MSRILVIAPHLKLPPRDGADVYIHRLINELSFSRDIDLFLSNGVVTYEKGKDRLILGFRRSWRNKAWALIRTVLFKSHYLEEKFNSSSFINHLENWLESNDSYDSLIFSYMSCYPLVEKISRKRNIKRNFIVICHNDEFAWFSNIRNSSRLWFVKRACSTSLDKVYAWLTANHIDIKYVNLNEEDQRGMILKVPTFRSKIVPVGIATNLDSKYHLTNFQKLRDGKLILSFLGSLNVKMNYDALLFFSQTFFLEIRKFFGEQVIVQVIGSNPTNQVKRIVRHHGWELHSDVSDSELVKLLSKSSFGILPFPYSTGSKLKELEYIRHFLPFLSTKCVHGKFDFDFCCYSNDAREWIRHIVKYKDISRDIIISEVEFKIADMGWNNSSSSLLSLLS